MIDACEVTRPVGLDRLAVVIAQSDFETNFHWLWQIFWWCVQVLENEIHFGAPAKGEVVCSLRGPLMARIVEPGTILKLDSKRGGSVVPLS